MKKFYSIILTASLLLLCSCGDNTAQSESEDLGEASVQTSELSSGESSEVGADASESTADSSTTASSAAGESAPAEIQVEYSQADIELQNILLENYKSASKYYDLMAAGSWSGAGNGHGADVEGNELHEPNIEVLFPQAETPIEEQYPLYCFLVSDELPFKTASELETGLNSLFSQRMTDILLERYRVCVAESAVKGEDGIYRIASDDPDHEYATFIEIDGRLYRSESTQTISEYINWSTAKVISQTEDEIVFGYLAYEPHQCDEVHMDFGRLRYEDGWKFDWDFYEHDDEVWLEEIWGMTSNCRAPFLPCYTDENADPSYIEEAPPIEITAEYSEEDIELQKLLPENLELASAYRSFLSNGRWEYGGTNILDYSNGDEQHEPHIKTKFPLSEIPIEEQYGYTHDLLSEELPFRTLSELEECMSTCFSKDMIEDLFDCFDVYRAEKVVKDDDGKYQVYIDDPQCHNAVMIEIDGRLYRNSTNRVVHGYTPVWSTAKVIRKTDDEIVFTYLGHDDFVRVHFGRLQYEDGWKYDWDFDSLETCAVWLEEMWGITDTHTRQFWST